MTDYNEELEKRVLELQELLELYETIDSNVHAYKLYKDFFELLIKNSKISIEYTNESSSAVNPRRFIKVESTSFQLEEMLYRMVIDYYNKMERQQKRGW